MAKIGNGPGPDPERNANMKTGWTVVAGGALAVAVLTTFGKSEAAKDQSVKTSEASVVTNDNGSVSRAFTECNVTTNGNMVTEHRRETRTTLDTDGNVLESSTSEYSQSYTVGDEGMASLATRSVAAKGEEKPVENADSFLGLKFGEVFESTNLVSDAQEPTLLRTTFVPKKPLAGFDDYYVYVTPKTHQVVKVYACARETVEPGVRWRRHYLIEALEQRYRTWARLCSYSRPLYAFNIGGGRYVTACLANATCDYGTVVCAWDDAMLSQAADETEAIRQEALKSAAEKRKVRVNDAAAAF